jgi:hypothetical protein
LSQQNIADVPNNATVSETDPAVTPQVAVDPIMSGPGPESVSTTKPVVIPEEEEEIPDETTSEMKQSVIDEALRDPVRLVM